MLLRRPQVWELCPDRLCGTLIPQAPGSQGSRLRRQRSSLFKADGRIRHPGDFA